MLFMWKRENEMDVVRVEWTMRRLSTQHTHKVQKNHFQLKNEWVSVYMFGIWLEHFPFNGKFFETLNARARFCVSELKKSKSNRAYVKWKP